MNFFCRLLGHTWVWKTEDPKIRWTTDQKTLARLDATAAGEPVFFWECARCHDRKPAEVPSGAGRPEAAAS